MKWKIGGWLICLAMALSVVAYATSVNQADQVLTGGFQTGSFSEVWDLTAGDMYIVFWADLTGLSDAPGAHAWSQLGVRAVGYGDFNPTFGVEGAGVWMSTDYGAAGTFDPDPAGSPTLDLDDKLMLQKAGGHGEADYNLPSVPPSPGNNHRMWFDRDGVDPWQALHPLAVDGGTYNTGGIYQIVLRLHATSATTGTAYMTVNGLDQGFETDGNWNTMELTPAGMTFTGDMSQMQVFYGMYGYGATHTVSFGGISIVMNDVVYVDDDYPVLAVGDVTADGHHYGWDAFDTLEGGVGGVAEDGTVHVAAGTYAPSSTVNVTTNGISILGPQANVDPRPSAGSARVPGGPGEAVITGGGVLGRIIYIDADNVELNGLDIHSGTSDMVRQSNAHSGTIVRFSIIHNGLGDEGVQLANCTDGLMEYNYVFDIAWAGDGLNFADSQDCTIQYNEITNVSSDNAAVYIYGSENTSIIGNLIYDLPYGEGIKLGNKSGGDAAHVGGLIQDNLIYNVGGPNRDDAIAVYTSHVQLLGNEVYNVASENGAIYFAFAISDILMERNVVRDSTLLTNKWAQAAGILVGQQVDAASVVLHYNSIHGNTPYGVTNLATTGDDLDASLNWWGDASGPSGEGAGSGDAVSTNVIYSPWLGIDPDGDPGTVGVQLVSPMLFVVDDVGPAPADGYLDAAFLAANDLPGDDTILVKDGTYAIDEAIEDGVTLVSEGGAGGTIVNGPLVLDSANVLIGRMREGFTFNGPITVLAGIDASTIEIHWNDIYDVVTNAGEKVLDATFNFWDYDGPDTVGRVRVNPYLPVPADELIGYIDGYGFSVMEAITFARLLLEGRPEGWSEVAAELVSMFGLTPEEAMALIREYGLGAVKRALRVAETLDEFMVQLMGYGKRVLAGGGGGAVDGTPAQYTAGELVPFFMELTHPVTGETVDDELVTYTVTKLLESGMYAFVSFGVMPYDAGTGGYGIEYDTTGLEPGIYEVYLAATDGDAVHFQIEIVE